MRVLNHLKPQTLASGSMAGSATHLPHLNILFGRTGCDFLVGYKRPKCFWVDTKVFFWDPKCFVRDTKNCS